MNELFPTPIDGKPLPGQPTATLLVVDDEPANLAVMNAVLQPHFRVRVARSGADALRAVASAPVPDLVLLDVMMPEMDGYSVLAKLRESPLTRPLPVIFVTAMDAPEDEQHGLELGAVDYITKPVSPPIVLARVRTQLALKTARQALAGQNSRLEALVVERTSALSHALKVAEHEHQEMRKSYFGTLLAISALMELRGANFGGHSRRVADLAKSVADGLGLEAEDAQAVFIGALLHDIGRIGYPEALLSRPIGELTPDERIIHRKHPVLGADALNKVEALAGISDIVRYHHEHFDGSGYPEGRSGMDIPVGSRIIAPISDYDDYLSGAISGKPASRKDSRRHLLEGSGHRYDPAVINILEPLLAREDPDEVTEMRLVAAQLKSGMKLARDLLHPKGFLLLSKNTKLERREIRQIAELERAVDDPLEIFVFHHRI